MRKKLYTKPELHVNHIDNEISLIMMTSETKPPDEPLGAAQETTPEQGPTEQNNFNNNPFGE